MLTIEEIQLKTEFSKREEEEDGPITTI